jgi:hypothetical protein
MSRSFPVTGEISGLKYAKPGSIVGNCRVSGTTFHNNHTARPRLPSDRVWIKDVTVHQCRHFACSAFGARFEDVLVQDVKGDRSFLWGCTYSRVTFCGSIAGILFRWQVDPNDARLSREFLLESARYYQSVEWALDLRDAKFTFLQSMVGVPSRLIRRNPKHHFVLHLESARKLAVDGEVDTLWRSLATELVDLGLPDSTIIVPSNTKSQKVDWETARKLQAQGVLE